ncbi:hypothetical protein QAD02_000508 [Eretmocerus hayati]|uniref:Uncharacterized protein n=1 Tax=Eretmocerus hayati TaxID=131215 RepID=A0ACC2NDG4_9HYME|nr:hypothetical protein QAD02_000508 [Eretmocerus hayati]
MQDKKVDGDGHLFINKRNGDCLKMILKHRGDFGICHSNKYLFAIPTHPGQEETFSKLSPVFAKLAAQCKMLHPDILEKTVRATKIRSHHATLNSAMENGVSVENMAKYSSHSTETHEQRYKEHIDKTDVTVTKQLEALTGDTEEQSSNILSEQAEIAGHEPSSEEISINFRSSSPIDHVENSNEVQNSPTEVHTGKAHKAKPIIKSIKTVNVKGQKTRWTTAEIEAFSEAFARQLDENRAASSVSSVKMREAQMKYPVLQNRTEAQMRTRFSNKKRKAENK